MCVLLSTLGGDSTRWASREESCWGQSSDKSHTQLVPRIFFWGGGYSAIGHRVPAKATTETEREREREMEVETERERV